MTDRIVALRKLRPNSLFTVSGENIVWNDPDNAMPSEKEIRDKIQELVLKEPMRLLRIERNNLLTQTDWRIIRGLEKGLDITDWKIYREDLRDLPSKIESGLIPAPTMDEGESLTLNFDHWPISPEY